MNYHIAVALTSCLLAGVFGQFSADWGMLGWIGFASWACFFAAGAGIEGAKKTLITTLWGMLIGCGVVYVASTTGMSNPMLLPLTAGVFIMFACGMIPFLSFVPGAFIGCAAFLGSGALLLETTVSLLVGITLGFIAERAALVLVNKTSKSSSVQ